MNQSAKFLLTVMSNLKNVDFAFKKYQVNEVQMTSDVFLHQLAKSYKD
jgi:hypothetical protein